MIAKSLATLALLGLVDAKNLTGKLRHPRRGPTVRDGTCSTAADRLKAGPANFPEIVHEGNVWTDPQFTTDADYLYWETYHADVKDYYDGQLDSGDYWFQRWPEVFEEGSLFNAGGVTETDFTDSQQGEAGTCYLMASLSAVAEFPELIENVFLSTEDNAAGIYGIQFYIRGKPWTMTVDDNMLFMFPDSPMLKFAQPDDTNTILWPAILEKAWAKMKGTYTMVEGGYVPNGLKAITGAPAFYYINSEYADQVSAVWDMFVGADALDYIMGAGTSGGSDQSTNSCGIANGHAYSIVSAFTMTDSDDVDHKMLMLRNPWGDTSYSHTWHKDDENWTEDLVDQVPYDIDPRTSDTVGIFFMDIDSFMTSECINDFVIQHYRNEEGYSYNWYDLEDGIDTNEDYTLYYITIPEKEGSMYFTLDTYYEGIIPNDCQTGTFESSGVTYSSNVNVAYFDIAFQGESTISYAYYFDQFAKPILLKTFETGDVIVIGVSYLWFSDVADYTINIYSKMDLEITDADDSTSILHYDGQEPSGFTESTYRGMDWEAPPSDDEEEDGDDGEVVADLTGIARIFAAESIGELIVAILALFFPFF